MGITEARADKNSEMVKRETPLHVCVDRLPQGERFRSIQDPRLAAETVMLWPPERRTLEVRFLGGDAAVWRRVMAVAREWNDYSGLPFVFTDNLLAPVRVAFHRGQGSWSYIGSAALTVRRNEPTINLGWITTDTDEEELRRVVLHEFGHTLGLIHEHNSPAAAVPWDKEAVYAYYAGPPNYWSRRLVDENLFNKYNATLTNYSQFDPQSIMLYPIPPELTGGKLSIGWNRALSPTDKLWIGKLYPKQRLPAA